MRVIVYQASDTSALSKNFTRKDFKCPCGCTRQMVDSELVEKLQAIRDKLGKAIKVTSGYRRGHRERSAESAGGARTGRGRHLRSCQLESHFRGFQVPVKHPI